MKNTPMVAQKSSLPTTSKHGNTLPVPKVTQPANKTVQGSNKVKGAGDEGKGSTGTNKLSTSVMSRCKC